jgi:myosin heavy subunit
MSNPFSLNPLSRNKSAESQLIPVNGSDFRLEQSEKQFNLINPFTLPSNDPILYHQREVQRIDEEKYRKAIKYYPLQDRHTFNQPKSIISEMRKDISESEFNLPAVKSRRAMSSKKETIKEFIQRKREILLVKKNIENKKSKYNELEENILKKEEKHKANIKELEDNKGRVIKFEEQLKLAADTMASQAEKRIIERNEKQKELKALQEEIDLLKAKVDREKDELKILEDYKAFVEELVPTENKAGVFLTESSLSLESIARKLQEAINSLETSNLFQIQQAQEDEQELEMLRHRNHELKLKENARFYEMKTSVHGLEQQKKILEEKIRKISVNEGIELPIDEHSSKRVHTELVLLFEECGGDLTNNPKELEMLETIEKAFEKLLKDKDRKNKEILKKVENEISKEHRLKKVEDQNIKPIKRNEKIKKIEQLKEKFVKKVGRKDMKRSKLHEKVEIKEAPNEPQEVLDRREFLETDN